MRKTIGAIGLGTVLVLAAGTACSSAAANEAGKPAPAATVNGQPIDATSYERRLGTVTENDDVKTAMRTQKGVRERLRADVLAQMIEATLIAGEAKKMGVEVTDKALQDYVDDITKNYLGGRPGAWQAFLKERGYPEVEVRQQLREDLRRERVEDKLAGDVQATNAQVSAVYDKEYKGRSLVRHILVKNRGQAEQLLAQLRDGADFGKLAERNSIDYASAAQGGELGPYIRGQYVASFEEAVEQADDGELLGPIASPFGFHVIERMAPPKFADMKAELSKKLKEQQQDAAVTQWVAGLRQQADITVRKEYGTWDAQTGKIV